MEIYHLKMHFKVVGHQMSQCYLSSKSKNNTRKWLFIVNPVLVIAVNLKKIITIIQIWTQPTVTSKIIIITIQTIVLPFMVWMEVVVFQQILNPVGLLICSPGQSDPGICPRHLVEEISTNNILKVGRVIFIIYVSYWIVSIFWLLFSLYCKPVMVHAFEMFMTVPFWFLPSNKVTLKNFVVMKQLLLCPVSGIKPTTHHRMMHFLVLVRHQGI